MVKSYQGQQIDLYEKAVDQPVSVCDHMSKNLITFSPEQSIHSVASTLVEENISGGLVLDKSGSIVGIISEGDCIKQLVKDKYYNHFESGGIVSDFMTKEVVCIKDDLTIFDVAELFLEKRIKRFPVLNQQGKLIGQISQKDVLAAIKQLRSDTWLENEKPHITTD